MKYDVLENAAVKLTVLQGLGFSKSSFLSLLFEFVFPFFVFSFVGEDAYKLIHS